MLGLEGIPPGSAQVAGGYSAHFLLSSVYLCDRLNSLTATQISFADCLDYPCKETSPLPGEVCFGAEKGAGF